jgi:hypothetical protein
MSYLLSTNIGTYLGTSNFYAKNFDFMPPNGRVYTQFGVGAYLPAPTGVRAPWRKACRNFSYFWLLP